MYGSHNNYPLPIPNELLLRTGLDMIEMYTVIWLQEIRYAVNMHIRKPAAKGPDDYRRR